MIGTIILILIAIILLVGIIRVIIKPYDGLTNLLMEMMLIDWMTNGFCAILDSIGDSDWD